MSKCIDVETIKRRKRTYLGKHNNKIFTIENETSHDATNWAKIWRSGVQGNAWSHHDHHYDHFRVDHCDGVDDDDDAMRTLIPMEIALCNKQRQIVKMTKRWRMTMKTGHKKRRTCDGSCES